MSIVLMVICLFSSSLLPPPSHSSSFTFLLLHLLPLPSFFLHSPFSLLPLSSLPSLSPKLLKKKDQDVQVSLLCFLLNFSPKKVFVVATWIAYGASCIIQYTRMWQPCSLRFDCANCPQKAVALKGGLINIMSTLLFLIASQHPTKFDSAKVRKLTRVASF